MRKAHTVHRLEKAAPKPAPPAPLTRPQKDPLVVLHVGCGSKSATALHSAFTGPGWEEVRLDIDPSVDPDIVASITDMSCVVTCSVDAIFSSHNLEHLEAHEVSIALAEFLRVLTPGGMLLVTLPDLQAVAQLIAEGKLEDPVYTSPAGPVAPLDILYGFRPYIARGARAMAHRTGFTRETLRKHLATAGFAEGRIWTQELDLWAMVTKP